MKYDVNQSRKKFHIREPIRATGKFPLFRAPPCEFGLNTVKFKSLSLRLVATQAI